MLAIANIIGSTPESKLKGVVYFKDVPNGTEVSVEVNGLPNYSPASGNNPQVGPHGFHIHENGICEVTDVNKPFDSTGGHWNPTKQPHGNHSGDFPVLFSNNGYAKMTFFTDKFSVKDIIGKSIVIHEGPDDYHTQPAGGSGKRIGCGVIEQVHNSRYYENCYET